MKGRILYAKPYAESKIEELKVRVEKLNKTPKLVIIRVEGDEASERYVRNKNKRADEVGIEHETILFPSDVSQEEVKNKIEELNSDDNVDGILLQLPLPKHLDEHYLMNLIDVEKDVDGLTYINIGKLTQRQECNIACTPLGICSLLEFYGINLKGKSVLIINDSVIVGRSLAMLLLNKQATPTIAHIHTKNLKDKIKRADIIVSATGQLRFLNADDFVEGQIIVDVSINVNELGKLEGDVDKSDYDKLIEKNVSIVPVPGGIGVTTVISLIENVIEVVERREIKGEI